jgi:xanthine dehydrogenase YagR molybdenum-binding subunit
MGLSMALHEGGVLDTRFGDIANHDFASYHIATNADVGAVDVMWIDEEDQHIGPLGAKGIGEIGIVGTAAAIANAVYHATGIRVRDLPITLDKLLP